MAISAARTRDVEGPRSPKGSSKAIARRIVTKLCTYIQTPER